MKHTFVILAYNESDDLEECIKSVINQNVKSNIVIATSTPNDYIIDLASNYSLGVMVNKNKSNKGGDYNFSLNSFDTELITIAHQDDLYDRNYTKEIIACYEKHPEATIIFTDNYEIKDSVKIKKSKKLFWKRYFIFPLRFKLFQNKKIFKIRSLRRDKYICTSSITFVKKNIKKEVFPTNLKYDNDWQGLINLAKENTSFVYLSKKLVGYRVIEKKNNKIKEKEDEKIRSSLYPKWYYNKFIKKYDNKENKNN